MGSPNISKEPVSPLRQPLLHNRLLALTTRRDPVPKKTPGRQFIQRIAKTAPALGRRLARRYDLMKLHEITFKANSYIDLELTPGYEPNSGKSYFEQCFTIIRKVGHGSFGEVYAVTSHVDHGKYAVKIVQEALKYSSNRTRRHHEVKMFEAAPPHENLVAFLKAWEESGRLHIQTELCETNLAELRESSDNITECDIWHFLIDLIKAVRHLHHHELIHVDIKPANVLVTTDVVCKLGDFGLMVDLNSDDRGSADEGDCRYLAKEVLNDAPTKEADIFSLGMTILEIITKKQLPPNGDEWEKLRVEPIPDEMFEGYSDEMKRVIRAMTCVNPMERPTAEQLLSEPGILRMMESEPWNLRPDKLEITSQPIEDSGSPITPTTVAKPNRAGGFSSAEFMSTPNSMISPKLMSTGRDLDEFSDDDFAHEEENRRRTFAFERNQDRCVRRLRFDSDDDEDRPPTPSNTMIYADGDSPSVFDRMPSGSGVNMGTPLKRSVSAIKLNEPLPEIMHDSEVPESLPSPYDSPRYNLRSRKTPSQVKKRDRCAARKLSFGSSPSDRL